MTQVTQVTQAPLTFEELRLANLLHPHSSPSLFTNTDLMGSLDDALLAKTLAELVIQADWLAASRGIDLVTAIRNCFAVGDSLDVNLERK